MVPIYSLIRWPVRVKGTGKLTRQDERVLGFDESRGLVALISTDSPNRWLRTTTISILKESLENKVAIEVTTGKSRKTTTKGVREYQERVFQILLPFRTASSEFLFNSEIRTQLLNRAAIEGPATDQTVRNYLIRYLQAGCRVENIICGYGDCGQPKNGIRILVKKQGAPKKYLIQNTKFTGMPLSDRDKADVIKGIEKYVVGIKNQTRGKIRDALQSTLLAFFRKEIVGENGESTWVFRDILPTEDQFKTVLDEFADADTIRRSRKSSAANGTSERSTASQSTQLNATGPGRVYQVDSTVSDVYLVDECDVRYLRGRPTLYYVVDVWSRMIVGYHLTFKPASYEAACMALYSVCRNKVELCRQLGIKITPEQWPDSPFCSILVSDRQEFLYKKSDILNKRLSTTLVNTPAYRGDMKGLVESAFNRAMRSIRTLPGAVNIKASRDEPDSKFNALLTLRKLEEFVVRGILRANRTPNPHFPLPLAASELEKPPLTPAKRFIWGKKHKVGTGLNISPEVIAKATLPPASSSRTTRDGIRISSEGVHSVYFVRPPEFHENLFKTNGGINPITQIDLSTMRYAIVEHPDTGELLTAPLDRIKSPHYWNMSWHEAAEFQKGLITSAKELEEENLELDAKDYDSTTANIKDGYDARRNAGPLTKAEATSQIKYGRSQSPGDDVADRTGIQPPTPDQDPFEPTDDDEDDL